jgi:hypothetical protein
MPLGKILMPIDSHGRAHLLNVVLPIEVTASAIMGA